MRPSVQGMRCCPPQAPGTGECIVQGLVSQLRRCLLTATEDWSWLDGAIDGLASGQAALADSQLQVFCPDSWKGLRTPCVRI
jgi:hypothetical protein